jgi:hypothetical protein
MVRMYTQGSRHAGLIHPSNKNITSNVFRNLLKRITCRIILHFVVFHVLTATSMNMTVFWDAATCSLVYTMKRNTRTGCPNCDFCLKSSKMLYKICPGTLSSRDTLLSSVICRGAFYVKRFVRCSQDTVQSRAQL